MNRESVELGLVLKQIPRYDFSMNTFPDRLKLQKMVYLLQAFDVYLGYDFSWYLRGPYCSILATNGFMLQDVYGDIPAKPVKFERKHTQDNFKKFIEFVYNKDVDELEIAASLHHLKKVMNYSDNDAKVRVARKQRRFTKIQVDEIWEELNKCHLL